MLENKENFALTIFDSDEIDTLDSFIIEKSLLETDEILETECQFEKIDLNKFSQEITSTTNNTIPSPREIGKLYTEELINSKNSKILDPSEFISEIQSLRQRSEITIEKLKSLHSKCSLGIVDLEHKIEFEVLDEKEGQDILKLLRKVIIFQRHIKDTLEKYKSISQVTQMLDKAFTEGQLDKLDKVEEFQASRVYTPRVFNIVERKNYPTTKISIQNIEEELNMLIETTNSRYERV